MNRVRKTWHTVVGEAGYQHLVLSVGGAGLSVIQVYDITGASPAYVEALVERLNIHINNMLYELGRIPR